MNKQLFVFDCDGTLVNDERELISQNIIALQKAANQGHKISICTGRTFSQLTKYINQLPFIDYVCTLNGGVINDIKNNKNIILAQPIGRDVIDDMVQLAMQYKRELQWTDSNEKMCRVFFGNNPRADIIDQSFFNIGTKDPVYDDWQEVKQYLYNNNILHLSVKMETSLIDEPFNLINNKYGLTNKYSVIKTANVYIDVDAFGVNKAIAVKYLQNQYHISNHDTFVFGDSDNDISMFDYTKNGVVLSNGTKSLKAKAKYFIASNNEPSIAFFINNLLTKKYLEPSLLAFDLNKIKESLQDLKAKGIKYIHYDVMDEFVNNHSFDIEWMQTIKDAGLEIIVHFMVNNPMAWIDRFAQFKPYAITFQYEAVNYSQAISILKYIKSLNIKAGIAIKPFSKKDSYVHLLNDVDLLTMMTVEPGKGGQQFIDEAINNILFCLNYKNKYFRHYDIEVDGGVKLNNLNKIRNYVNYVVSGSGLMALDSQQQNEFIKQVQGDN